MSVQRGVRDVEEVDIEVMTTEGAETLTWDNEEVIWREDEEVVIKEDTPYNIWICLQDITRHLMVEFTTMTIEGISNKDDQDTVTISLLDPEKVVKKEAEVALPA